MFFNSIKEINRLLSKGMSKLLSEKLTFSKLWFSKFKKVVTRSVFGELQLAQISRNLQNVCCNLKIRGLGAKLCGFSIILILKGIMTF